MRGFLKDKRAISVALTTMIITAGVIAAGIAVMYWTYGWGNVANQQTAQMVTNSQSAMQENIGFEYVTYSNSNPNNQLSIYIINCGKSNNVSIARAYLWDSAHQPLNTIQIVTLYNVDSGTSVPNKLNIGDEACVRLSPSSPLA